MTTNHHTAIATGAAANAGTINSPLEELDAAIDSQYFFPAEAFGVALGSPVRGAVGDASYPIGSWQLDDANFEFVSLAFEHLGGPGSTIYIDVWWAMASATSGDVVMRVVGDPLADGESTAATPANTQLTLPVPGTAEVLEKTTFTVSVSYQQNDLIEILVGRVGSSGSDTATGDLHFIGAAVRLA